MYMLVNHLAYPSLMATWIQDWHAYQLLLLPIFPLIIARQILNTPQYQSCHPIRWPPRDIYTLFQPCFPGCGVYTFTCNLTNVKITNADMYSNATDVLWTISNISYNMMQMWYDENDGQWNETNTR